MDFDPKNLSQEDFDKYIADERAKIDAMNAYIDERREYLERMRPKMLAAIESGDIVGGLLAIRDEEIARAMPENGVVPDEIEAFDVQWLTGIGEIEEIIRKNTEN